MGGLFSFRKQKKRAMRKKVSVIGLVDGVGKRIAKNRQFLQGQKEVAERDFRKQRIMERREVEAAVAARRRRTKTIFG